MKFEKNKVKIIILTGKAGSGKSRVAKLISDNKKCMILSYASYLKEVAKNVIDWDGKEETKPRDFLQQFGDEIKNIRSDILINRVLEDIEVYSYFYDLIVISDARFIDEIEMVRNKFDDVVVVNIYGRDNELNDMQRNHSTEVSLDNYDNYDYKIFNDENIEEKVERLVKNIYE